MKRTRVTVWVLIVSQVFLLTSCFTGIENTKKIELSRKDRKQLEQTREEAFLSDLDGRPLAQWKAGDRFLVSDSKIALLFDNAPGLSPDDPSLTGRHLSFDGKSVKLRPDRTEEQVILFRDSVVTYRLPSGTEVQKADSSLLSTRLPMLIDLETVDEIAKRMEGKELWTRTQLWYDVNGEKVTGRKYVPVKVTKVLPGSQLFPIKVVFTDDRGEERMLWMSYGLTVADSRKFPVLFSFTDPRQEYPSVSDENWVLIQNGEIANGMTKLECRLALGNPADVMSGHSHSETLDLWQYPDGSYLRFADGVLVEFRR